MTETDLQTQSQNDLMRDWLPRRDQYLQDLLGLEDTAQRTCATCGADGRWRCKECFARPLLCTTCCKAAHAAMPFHRIEHWQGEYFEDAALRDVGVCIDLGHGGGLCPHAWVPALSRDHPQAKRPRGSDSDSGEDDAEEDPGHQIAEGTEAEWMDIPYIPFPRISDPQGYPLLTVVDTSGVHGIGVRWCNCPDAMPRDRQLLAMGLYPASVKNPRTAFTFRVLDAFLIANKECKTPAGQYFAMLRRITNNAFPHRVPVSDADQPAARVLMTSESISRAHARVKAMAKPEVSEMAWSRARWRRKPGGGIVGAVVPSLSLPRHQHPRQLERGPRAVSNTAVRLRMADRVFRWKYRRILVMDGNFTAEHMKMRNPDDDVELTDGHGFMVGEKPYKEHLKSAVEDKEVSNRKCMPGEGDG